MVSTFMETKFFRSKYSTVHKSEWESIIKILNVHPYDVIVPCELAVILGGYFENPQAFKDCATLVFYKKDMEDDGTISFKTVHDKWSLFEKRKYEVWESILNHYFDEMVDLTGLTPEGAAEKIRGVVETYQR